MIQSEIREFIFEENREAPSCHASTVLPLEGGRVLAAWFAGAHEGADDVGIWLSVRENGAWSCPRRITPEDGVPHWNPVLYRGKDGAVRLFYKAGRTIQGWKTWVTVSRDGGGTWSEPRLLVEGDTSGGRGPVKNKCLLLSDGTLLRLRSRKTTGGPFWTGPGTTAGPGSGRILSGGPRTKRAGWCR